MTLASTDFPTTVLHSMQRVAASDNQAIEFARETMLHLGNPTADQLQVYLSAHPEMVEAANMAGIMVSSLVGRNYDEETLYAKLWDLIDSSELFDSEEERALAYWLTLNDRRFPYRHFDALAMSDERFAQLTTENDDRIGLLQQIAMRTFPQKTQEASAVLEIVDGAADHEARCVCMARYIETVRTLAMRR